MRPASFSAALLFAAFACAPLGAHAGGDGQPPATAVTSPSPANEPPDWQRLDSGLATIPGIERGVLIQGRGNTWRNLRPPILWAGGAMLAGSVAALVFFFLWRGPIGVSAPPTGRMIERFTRADRAAHWTMGIGFVILALTGLILAAGRRALLPVLGHEIFSPIALASKGIHAFLGLFFTLSLAYFIARYFRDNLPRRHDLDWLRKFGGMFSGKHVPSGRFNAGEKTLFWGLVCGICIVLSASGLVLDFPNFAQGRALMQDASLIHLAAGFMAIAASLFHMYLGTVGVKGAYRAMRDGTVDESWAREHHELWYDEVKAGKSRQRYVGTIAPAALVPAGED